MYVMAGFFLACVSSGMARAGFAWARRACSVLQLTRKDHPAGLEFDHKLVNRVLPHLCRLR